MTNTLNTKIRSGFRARLVGDPDLGSTKYNLDPPADQELTTGTTSGKANQLFSDTRTLSASGSEDLDLAGSLANPFGETITFAKVKGIRIRAASTNGGNITIGAASSNDFSPMFGNSSDTIVLPAGAEFQLSHPTDGWTVTGGSADLLKIANSDSENSGSYDIEIIGTQ